MSCCFAECYFWRISLNSAAEGKAKAIGVSNFSQPVLEKILAQAEILPAVDQVVFFYFFANSDSIAQVFFSQLELHVYNPQHKLLRYLRSKNILPQAYAPLGSSNTALLTDEAVVDLASKYSINPSDILLGYLGALARSACEAPFSSKNPSVQGDRRASQVRRSR